MRTIRPGTTRLSRAALAAGPAAAVVLCIVSLLAPPAAFAHRDPTIAVVLDEISPDLPDTAAFELFDSELTYAALSNDASEPVYALEPDGSPFLSVSKEGVYGDLDSPYLNGAPRDIDPDDTVDMPCCAGGKWVELSTKPAWLWADPRLDPVLQATSPNDQRGLGEMSAGQPLATWQIDLRSGDTTYTAKGILERRTVGQVTTTIDQEPAGISASIIESRPPQIRIQVQKGMRVAVLGDDGRTFLRISPKGTFGRISSPEYQAHLQAVGLPVPRSGTWQRVSGSGATKASWADIRLNYDNKVPSDPAQAKAFVINDWRIPVRVNGEQGEITGESTWAPVAPPPLPSDTPRRSFWAGDTRSYLIAGGITAAVVGAYVLARIRRKEA